MRTYTNLAWPDDPYRTGQQLYPRPAPRLAAFTVSRSGGGSRLACRAAAIVYLPLHRTRVTAITQQTMAFGFRAASTDSHGDAPALVRVADLDLMQARRHAAILAGHLMAADLAALKSLAGETVPRGVTAAEREWAGRGTPVKGKAVMVDSGLDLPGAPALAQACQGARISISENAAGAETCELAAARAVERALIIGLVCAWHLGRYTWEQTLDADEIMAASAWDRFPQLHTGCPASTPDSGPGISAPAQAGGARGER